MNPQPTTDPKTNSIPGLKQLRLLAELSIEIGQDGSPRSQFQAFLEKLRKLIPYDGASIYLLSAEDELRELASIGGRVQFLDYLSIGGNPGLAGWVAGSRKPVLIPHRKRDMMEEPDGEYQTILSVPVLKDEQLLGILNLGSFRAGVFDNNTVKFAEPIATQVGHALQTYRLAEKLRETTEQLKRMRKLKEEVSQATGISAKLRQAAQTAMKINHEINNPLSVIVGNVQCLVMEKAAANQKALSRLRRIESAALRISRANRMLGKIHDMVSDNAPEKESCKAK